MSKSRRFPIILTVVLILIATSIAGWWARERGGADDPAAVPPSTATAEIVRQDLSTSVSMSGELGYGIDRLARGGVRGGVVIVPDPDHTCAVALAAIHRLVGPVRQPGGGRNSVYQ